MCFLVDPTVKTVRGEKSGREAMRYGPRMLVPMAASKIWLIFCYDEND